jgi:hypothetical protein
MEIFPWVTSTGFDQTGSRTLSFLKTPVRPEVCDVDGDGDLDFVATVSLGGDATRTWVALNRVR